jgi:hypothetical protein
MASIVKIKRSSIKGKSPNTSILQTGELALNVRDFKLFSSNGTAIFEVGSNLNSLFVGTGGLTIGNGAITFPTADGTTDQFLRTHGNGSLYFSTISFVTNSEFQSYVANTNSRIDSLEAGGTLVTNSYLTSTYVTNTTFQSTLANTNAKIIVLDSNIQETNNSIRSLLISDYVTNSVITSTYTPNSIFQSFVANTNPRFANYLEVSNVASYGFVVQNDIDVAIANLVNSAPSTLDTLKELAIALGNDENFATTVTNNLGQKLGATATVTLTGDVSGNASFSANAITIITSITAGTGGFVGNAYLTSTYVTNSVFQSALANTNSSISDRMQVANTITLANARLGANATITLSGDVTGSGTFSANAVSIEVTVTDDSHNHVISNVDGLQAELDAKMSVANTQALYNTLVSNTLSTSNATSQFNDRMQVANTISLVNARLGATATVTLTGDVSGNASFSANAITISTSVSDVFASNTFVQNYTAKYIEVANVGGTSFISNTAPTGKKDGDFWWNNATGDFFILYANAWIETTPQDLTPYTNNAIFYSGNNTIRFVRTDDTIFDVALTGVSGDVSNAYLTSTFVTNTDFQSYVANTNPRLDALESSSSSNGYITATFVTNTVFQSALANTNAQFVAYWPSANVIAYTAKYLEVANSSAGGASVSVQNTAPSGASEGDLWWNNFNGDLFVYYSNNWVEATAQDVSPYTNNAIFYSGNNTIRFVRTDDTIFDVELTGIGSGGGDVSNAYLTSTFVTNTDFQSALANTNAQFTSYWPSANIISYTNKYLEVANAVAGSGDVSNAYLTSTFVTNTDFQSALANTNAQFVSYWPSANIIAYTNKYLEVANAAAGSGDVSNAYLTSTFVTNTDFQSALANTNAQFVAYWPSANIISYTNKYLEVANAVAGSGDVSNAYLTSTFVTNTDFQSYVSNTNSWIESLGVSTTILYDEYTYTATANQVTFTGADDDADVLQYSVNKVNVYLNGVRLVNTVDYTATNGNTVVLTTGVSSNDVVVIETFGITPTITANTLVISNTSILSSNSKVSSSGSELVIDTFSSSTALSASYYVETSSSNGVHTTNINLAHYSNTVYLTEYGTIITGQSLATFDADINTGDVRLKATPIGSGITINVHRITFRN